MEAKALKAYQAGDDALGQQILNEQDQKRLQLKLEVESKSKYQGFLDSVCEDPAMSEYFESIENITMRYETLAAAHEDLTNRVESAQQQQEQESAELTSFIRSSQNDLLVYNSEKKIEKV